MFRKPDTKIAYIVAGNSDQKGEIIFKNLSRN